MSFPWKFNIFFVESQEKSRISAKYVCITFAQYCISISHQCLPFRSSSNVMVFNMDQTTSPWSAWPWLVVVQGWHYCVLDTSFLLSKGTDAFRTYRCQMLHHGLALASAGLPQDMAHPVLIHTIQEAFYDCSRGEMWHQPRWSSGWRVPKKHRWSRVLSTPWVCPARS